MANKNLLSLDTCQLSPLNTSQSHGEYSASDPVNIRHNCAKFEFNETEKEKLAV